MATYARELTRATTLYANSTLVQVGTPVNSGFIRLPRRDVTITFHQVTGTYGLSIAWSNDGTNTAFTTTPSLTDSVASTITALAPYAKFTITATGSNFTVHQTNVMA